MKLYNSDRIKQIIREWERQNKEVLKTEDIIKDKIVISDYIKWDKVKELIKMFEEKKSK